MILTIDIGNANITFGGVEEDSILFVSRMNTDRVKTSDQYCIELKMLMEVNRVDLEKIQGAIIASVVPPVLNSLKSAVRKLSGIEPLVVGPGLKTGLNIQIENPIQTGADIVAACVAALQSYQPPMIIIDMGTATTMTVLNEKGALIGGSISPGVKMSLDALTDRTALLPGLQLDKPDHVIGHNTTDSMRSGMMIGNACMLDGMIERFEQELGQHCTVVATGGIGRFVTPLCTHHIIYDRDLLIKGLAVLYRENSRG